MIHSTSRFTCHQIEFSQLISHSNSRNQISSDRNVENTHSCHRGRDLEHDESNERQHLTNLRCQSVTDRFLDVVVDFSTLLDAYHNRTEVVVEQNHVSCVFSNVGTCDTHGHTDICFLDSRRVIHTVTSDSHDLTYLLASLDDNQFLSRSSPSEHYLTLTQPLL